MRPVLHYDQTSPRHHFRGTLSRGSERNDPVSITVNDQNRYLNASQVLAEVLMPCWNTSQTCSGGGARSDVPARLYNLLADARAQILVGIVEILEELGEERIAVRQDSLLNPLECTSVDSLRVVSSF